MPSRSIYDGLMVWEAAVTHCTYANLRQLFKACIAETTKTMANQPGAALFFWRPA